MFLGDFREYRSISFKLAFGGFLRLLNNPMTSDVSPRLIPTNLFTSYYIKKKGR